MNVDPIRKAVRQHPFKPFTLRMVDGSKYDVTGSEYIALSSRVVCVIDADTQIGVSLEPELIASMEEPSTPTGEADES